MILPQTNARLIRVSRGGTSEDYDRASEDYDVPASSDSTPTGGDDAFTGSADAYFGSRRATLVEGNARNVERIEYVIVPGDLGLDFAVGDVLTIEQHGEQFQRRVHSFADRELPNTIAQPIRLDLEAE